MSTQGLITITKNSKILVKIVCGCNGHLAKEIGALIKEKYPVYLHEIYILCLDYHFGCKDCLVVMNDTQILFSGGENEVDELYRKTFDIALFNPRRKDGKTHEFTLINIQEHTHNPNKYWTQEQWQKMLDCFHPEMHEILNSNKKEIVRAVNALEAQYERYEW